MTNQEKQIADEIAVANGLSVTKLGLRFDKVVVQVLGDLRASVEKANVKERTVVLTLTAPIKVPGKTQHELEPIIRDLLYRKSRIRDRRMAIFENEVRLRIIDSSSKRKYKFVGFVHNPSTDSKVLLDLATKWLTRAD